MEVPQVRSWEATDALLWAQLELQALAVMAAAESPPAASPLEGEHLHLEMAVVAVALDLRPALGQPAEEATLLDVPAAGPAEGLECHGTPSSEAGLAKAEPGEL